MAVIDIKKKTITGKIVYYGPGLCGKTTNLEFINRSVPNTQQLMSLSTEGDRTIFFDFLPMELGKIRGISTTFKLYTVPGQVRYNLTRKMVLKNVDGVVFVADSQAPMLEANIESLKNLFDNLRELGIKTEDIPMVLQYNKRDLPNLLSSEELDKALNPNKFPTVLASAMSGKGVLETLKSISKLVFNKLGASFGTPAESPKAAAEKKPIGVEASGGSPASLPLSSAGLSLESIQQLLLEQNQNLSALLRKHAEMMEPMSRQLGRQEAPAVSRSLGQFDPEITRRIENALQELVTKKEIEQLRQLLTDLPNHSLGGQGSDAALDLLDEETSVKGALKKLGKELTKIVEKSLKGLASKGEMEELREAIATLTNQTKATSYAQETSLPLLHARLSELLERFESQFQEIILSFKAAVVELTESISQNQNAKARSNAMSQHTAGLATSSQPAQPKESMTLPIHPGPASESIDTNIYAKESEEKIDTVSEEVLTEKEAASSGDADEDQPTADRPIPGEEQSEEIPSQASHPGQEQALSREPADENQDDNFPASKPTPSQDQEPEEDPRIKNAFRIARVMVADLNLYHSKDVIEGIKAGDIYERLKDQIEDMHKTFESRVPEDIRAQRNFLKETLDKFFEMKRKDLDSD